jgi:hypothetical protein
MSISNPDSEKTNNQGGKKMETILTIGNMIVYGILWII